MSSGIEFEYTGVSVVDSLLEAITEASDVYHDSTLWDEESEHPFLDGSTPAQWIESKAQQLATSILEYRKEIDDLKIALKCLKGELKVLEVSSDSVEGIKPTLHNNPLLDDLKEVDEEAYKFALAIHDKGEFTAITNRLDCAFYWHDTPQGWDYWFDVHTRLEAYRKSVDWGVSDEGNW